MNNFVNVILSVTLFDVVKWMMVIGLLMYVAFAGIIVRQVGIMSGAIEDDLNGVIKVFAWAHLLLAVFLLVVSWVIL